MFFKNVLKRINTTSNKVNNRISVNAENKDVLNITETFNDVQIATNTVSTSKCTSSENKISYKDAVDNKKRLQ